MRDRALLCAFLTIGIFSMSSAPPARAQDTNLAVFQQLAIECLGDLPSGIDTLVLDPGSRMPFLRTALIETWKMGGHEIYAIDTTPPQAAHLPRLAFTVEDAGVTYTRADRRRLNRRIRLGLRYSITDSDGRIITEDLCAEALSDTIDSAAVARFENEAYAETQGELPRAGWLRRIVEPAIITAATAIGVYLFFTLRSQSADDE